MSKKLLKFCFISLLLIISCAPKPRLGLPPALYLREDLTLEEIARKTGGDTVVIKIIADIEVLKKGKHFDSVNALFLAKTPGQVHARIYKFGILARDFIIKDGRLHVISGKASSDLKIIGTEMYKAVFWWENIERGVLRKNRFTYTIKTKHKEIRLDRGTLLPLEQNITTPKGKIKIRYDGPQESADGSWYPSKVYIKIDDFELNIKLKKMVRNPSLRASDFRIP